LEVATLKQIAHQQVIEEMEDSSPTVLTAVKPWCKRLTSRESRPASIGDGMLWHARMGHPGLMSLHMLGANSLEIKLQEFKIIQCPHCSLVKIKQQIS